MIHKTTMTHEERLKAREGATTEVEAHQLIARAMGLKIKKEMDAEKEKESDNSEA